MSEPYRTIVADPPWPSMHQRSTYHRGKPERHYSTMPVDDICDLPGPGMGYYLRNNTEHCILATRGKPMVPTSAALSSWYLWPRGRHSEKPSEFFEVVEEVSPDRRLEMFARRRRPGWDAWGDQVPDEVTA